MAGTLETAKTLRLRFKAMPQDVREANQPFSIRVWRGLSWLERSEGADDEIDMKFISLWIAFNAIYGREDGPAAGDRASWQAFIAGVVRMDIEAVTPQWPS